MRQNVLAAALDFAGDCEQSLELVRYGRAREIPFYVQDQLFISAQMMRGNRTVRGLAIVTIVLRGHIGSDQFTIALRKGARCV